MVSAATAALPRHRMELLLVVALVGQVESDDQLVLGIDRDLRIVSHLMALRRAHQLRIRLASDLLLEAFPSKLLSLALQLLALGLERRNRGCNIDRRRLRSLL